MKDNNSFWKVTSWKDFSVILTPLLILIIGVVLNDNLSNQNRILDYKLEIHRDIGVTLNDVFVYFVYVGKWKHYSPIDILDKKHEIDQIMAVNREFFSESYYQKYKNFMYLVFEKRDISNFSEPRLRTSTAKRREAFVSRGGYWNPEWDKLFTEEEVERKIINTTYRDLVVGLAKELEILR